MPATFKQQQQQPPPEEQKQHQHNHLHLQQQQQPQQQQQRPPPPPPPTLQLLNQLLQQVRSGHLPPEVRIICEQSGWTLQQFDQHIDYWNRQAALQNNLQPR